MRKWSKRNFLFISKKYGPLLYIGNTNNIVGLNYSDFYSIHDFIVHEKPLITDLYNQLEELGALDDTKLYDIYQYTTINSAFNSNSMELWICLTNTCNFKCCYCFENNTPVFLDDELINKTISFIQQSCPQIKKLYVHFYGGEPLLNTEKIFTLYNAIKAIPNIKTQFDIVTNGYLLSLNIFNRLQMIEDIKFQITLDGLEETHNKRRPHKTNKDSYKTIIRNLDDIYKQYENKEKKPRIAIRFNVDKENEDDFHKLYTLFHKTYHDFFYFFSTPVQDYCNGGEQYTTSMFTPEQYSHFILNNYNKYGIYESPVIERTRPDVVCGAAKKNFFCISSDGLVYKCPSEVGHVESAFYDLRNETFVNKYSEINYYINGNPLVNETCKNCFLLFQCMGGGCAKHVFYANKYNSKHNCIPLKFNTEEHLENMFKQQIKEKINNIGGIYDFIQKENC